MNVGWNYEGLVRSCLVINNLLRVTTFLFVYFVMIKDVYKTHYTILEVFYYRYWTSTYNLLPIFKSINYVRVWQCCFEP